ncbi:glycoside hydrolase family 3 protein [Sphingomonas hengshuiensis]|uniref:Beta-glucosidase n=1 Tax=Sphingomonas hengshuiensis TaxID=1609977 RepID=A0A7U4J8X2_9SPHN|nr:glycoside hydrolase family 3 C-terminal domain-containing protein [Sphingomonas hengshuiensis]AJP72415.1 beta-glucosidase [Sphingomonas hengshuiensis]
MKFTRPSAVRASLVAIAGLAALTTGCTAPAARSVSTTAQPQRWPWSDPALPAAERAERALSAMTRDEKLTLIFGYFPSRGNEAPDDPVAAGGRPGSAGYVPGIARLGIPAQWQTNAGLGVGSVGGATQLMERTALPSGLAQAASWDLGLSYAGGAMIADEARRSGFNILLAGGINLVRDPRGGRNFEYASEDPLLSGVLVGEQIRGVQSQSVLSTIKHYAINAQESGREIVSSNIAKGAARMSDLLAFQIAIERGQPGAVMCAYNRFNGTPSCENAWLLTDVLRRDWGYRGFVLSDWGAVHSTVQSIAAGLDQQSAHSFDRAPFFGAPLRAALASGQLPEAALDTMVRRILTAMFATGLFDRPVAVEPATIDFAAHAEVSRVAAERGAVLLTNDGLLPIAPATKRILMIGGHADRAVLSGGGSSRVFPIGGNAVPNLEPRGWPGPVIYFPSSPLAELRRAMPSATIRYLDGSDPAAAVAAARESDIVIVVATQWATESRDVPLALDGDQDALIAAVASANPRTAVVLQTGGPILMPWQGKVAAILEAWYPGTSGGQAIARLLTGAANPSGRLPISFPASVAQLPRPALDVPPERDGKQLPFDVDYREGAAVGYRWFEATGAKPLFAFGHGLSYTRFAFDRLDLRVAQGTVTARVTVRNTGARAGVAVPQLYAGPVSGGWEAPRRLAGWTTVALAPGQSRTVTITVDPRLLAMADDDGKWRIAAGGYRFQLAASAGAAPAQERIVTLAARELPARR